jgi:hypothetical protein
MNLTHLGLSGSSVSLPYDLSSFCWKTQKDVIFNSSSTCSLVTSSH